MLEAQLFAVRHGFFASDRGPLGAKGLLFCQAFTCAKSEASELASSPGRLFMSP